MAAKLVGVMFLSRDLAHKAHLKAKGTGSFALHMATGSFYDAIVDLADKLAETYQGRHGLMEIPTITDSGSGPIDKVLEAHMKMIEKARYTDCDKNDTPIQNIVDEVVGEYLRALYKLRNLQ